MSTRAAVVNQVAAASLYAGVVFDPDYVSDRVTCGTTDVVDGQYAGSAHAPQLHQAAVPPSGEFFRGEERAVVGDRVLN